MVKAATEKMKIEDLNMDSSLGITAVIVCFDIRGKVNVSLVESMDGSPICRSLPCLISPQNVQNVVDGNACYRHSTIILKRQLNRYPARSGADNTVHGSAQSIYLQYKVIEAGYPIFSSR